MKHLMMIAALVLPVATGYSASTLTREIPTTSRFSREAFTNETAATWRAKLGVTAGGAATNAISDTNGIGVGLHEFDGVLATNYTGGGMGLTNIPESGVTGLVADLSSKTGTNETRAVIHTNAANTFRGTFYGDGSGLTGISGGGSASNVFFYPGNNITWSTVGGSNQANVTGTLSVDTTGTAGGLSAAVAQSLVTSLVPDLSGKSGTNETRAIIHTNAANQFRGTFQGVVSHTNLIGETNFWNVLNYGAAVYPADSTTAFNAAATNLSYAGGKLWFPRVIYGITGTVVIQGSLGSGMPLAAYDYGNFTVAADKHARIYADVGLTNAFLFRTATSQWRKSEIMDLSINGTNTTHAIVPTLVGMAFDGPSGGLEVSRINIQQMGVGYVADDVTGATFRNLIGVNCGIGFAFGYKPDGVVVTDSTFRTNQWGLMTMFTNAQFTTRSAQEGNPSVKQTVFGQNQSGGVLHSHGTLELDGCYFESNGPDTNNNVAVQIGLNTADPWQQSYTNNSPSSSKPRLFWKNTGMNYKHSITVYHIKGAEIYIESSKMEGDAIPVVRLMTSGADNSIIRCSMAESLWITNSSGTVFSVPMGYMFVSNAIVPISGMTIPSAIGTNTVYPAWNIAAWGDSMTMGLYMAQNQDYTTNLAKITGRTVYDGGVSGETALQIANRAVDATNAHMRPWTAIIWAGRNDFDVSMDNTNTIYTNINRMIQNVTSDRWLVLSVFNKTNEIAGTTEHAKITNFNGMLSVIYSNRYLDARAFIVSQTNGSVQDGLDQAEDIPPISLRQDGTHLNYIGYGRLAKYLSTRLPLIETNLLGTLVSSPDAMRALFNRPPALGGPAIIHNSGMSPSLQVVDSNGVVTMELRSGGLNEYAQETYVGYASGRASSGTGTAANTALGFETLRDNVSGTLNTAVGFKALQVTSGSGNTAVGSTALNLVSSGGNNTGIGNEALKVVTTATGNTGVGSGVGENTTGQLNTFVGYEAAQNHTTGGDNVAVGVYAMQNSVAGAGNVALGKLALRTVTNGSDNVAVGKLALQYNTGSRNIAVGYGAGFGDATVSAQNSSNDNYNIFFGFEASRSASIVGTAVTNSIALGNGAKLTESGQFMIGGGGATGVVNVATFGAYSSDGGATKTRMPTNAPVDGAVLTAAGTAGHTKFDTNFARLNGTNVFTGTNTFNSPVLVTNLILIPQAWSGPTNTLELSGGYKTYATATDIAITNLSGVVAGEVNWATLAVSNSAASAIVVRNTVGATVRLQGVGTTNALTVPAGKVGFMEFFTVGHTNLFSTVQQ